MPSAAYQHWFARFQRILSAYRHGFIDDANFTLQELQKLDYPRSPFARML